MAPETFFCAVVGFFFFVRCFWQMFSFFCTHWINLHVSLDSALAVGRKTARSVSDSFDLSCTFFCRFFTSSSTLPRLSRKFVCGPPRSDPLSVIPAAPGNKNFPTPLEPRTEGSTTPGSFFPFCNFCNSRGFSWTPPNKCILPFPKQPFQKLYFFFPLFRWFLEI